MKGLRNIRPSEALVATVLALLVLGTAMQMVTSVDAATDPAIGRYWWPQVEPYIRSVAHDTADVCDDYADAVGTTTLAAAEVVARAHDSDSLAAAKTYADGVGVATLAAANTAAGDSARLAASDSLAAAKTYADGVGTTTLAAANTAAGDSARLAASDSLAAAKTYADDVGTITLASAAATTQDSSEVADRRSYEWSSGQDSLKSDALEIFGGTTGGGIIPDRPIQITRIQLIGLGSATSGDTLFGVLTDGAGNTVATTDTIIFPSAAAWDSSATTTLSGTASDTRIDTTERIYLTLYSGLFGAVYTSAERVWARIEAYAIHQ